MTEKPLATVAIVGRPNVGKSTLFNRLVGKKLALVDDMPGVTRDRREGEGKLSDLVFRVIDTAGLEDATDESLEARMRRQTELAVAEADITLFVIDARAGITPADRHFGQLLRRSAGRVLLVANKAEGGAGQAGMFEAFELGLGEPIPISAEHGEGMADLFEALEPHVGRRTLKSKHERAEDKAAGQDEEPEEAGPPPVLQMAIVGRPNVGKSTMINQLIGEDRLLTGPEAGITRDSIAVPFQFEGQTIRLVDTAGIRRKARVQTKLEKLSVADTLRAVRYAQVVVLVLDATMPMEKQDLTIAAMVAEEGRGLLIALNKWDSVTNRDETLKLLNDRLSVSLTQVKGIPVIPCSGKTGRGLDQLLRAVFKLYGVWNQRQSTSEVNRWLEGATEAHPPPMVSGRRIKIRYATQVKTRPPTFALFVSKPEDLPDSYMQYLRNSLRESFGLDGVPVRLMTRKGKNPYAPD